MGDLGFEWPEAENRMEGKIIFKLILHWSQFIEQFSLLIALDIKRRLNEGKRKL